MALPTPEKTWTWAHVVPTPAGSRPADSAELLYGIKEALKALPVPWTVAGSNDGSVAAMDGVDRWTSPSVITFDGTSGHTWIVLQAPVGWGSAQVLLYGDNGGAFACLLHMKVSLSGAFTGGTTTTIPSATDEDTLATQEIVDFSGIGAGGGQLTSHISQSSDGQHTRVFNCASGHPGAVWVFETAGNPGGLWDGRFYGRGPINYNETPALGGLALVGNGGRKWLKMKNPNASGFPFLYFLWPEPASTAMYTALTVPNEISGEYPFWNLSLYNYTDAGVRGRLGRIKDWWLTVNAANPGDAFPGDGSKQFMVMGAAIVVRWDGSTPNFG